MNFYKVYIKKFQNHTALFKKARILLNICIEMYRAAQISLNTRCLQQDAPRGFRATVYSLYHTVTCYKRLGKFLSLSRSEFLLFK
jgi:hypothetical protein